MPLYTLFKIVEVVVDTPGSCRLDFLTDLPGNALAVRATATITATTGRHPYRLVLPGSTKGKLYQLKITPTGTAPNTSVAVYGAKVYARQLGPPAIPWAWYAVPGLFPTQDDWSPMKLPIEETSDMFTSMKLPIDPTSDMFTSMKLPIDPTSDVFTEMKLPIEPTGQTYTAMKLPIDPTSDVFTGMKLPVRETPVVPEWVSIPVDE
jgi:hypothetical protein